MRINYKHSEETKEKIRQRALGNTRRLGKKHSRETREKISIVKKGISVHTVESIEKIRKLATGRLHTDEAKEKIRQSKLRRPRSEETRMKISQSRLGKYMEKQNNNWKGDNVGNGKLHEWVRTRIPMPEFCQICEIKPPEDLANITGEYTRELTNWQYLCRKCHYWYDH